MERLENYVDEAITAFLENPPKKFVAPNPDFVNTVKEYISSLNEYEVGYFYIYPDTKGGLEISFNNDQSTLDLIVNNKREPYIFIKHNKNFRIVENVKKEEFINWFHRFNSNSLFQGN